MLSARFSRTGLFYFQDLTRPGATGLDRLRHPG